MRNASGQQCENERQYKEEKKKGEQLTQAAIFFCEHIQRIFSLKRPTSRCNSNEMYKKWAARAKLL